MRSRTGAGGAPGIPSGPPRSGRLREFPEIDRAGWFDLTTASEKLGKGQRPFLGRLAEYLD